MITLIISIMFGFMGIFIGGQLGCDIFAIFFGAIGFFGPSICLIDKIYRNIEKNKRP